MVSTRLLQLLTSCSKRVDNLGQAVQTQLVDSLLAVLLQDVKAKLYHLCKKLKKSYVDLFVNTIYIYAKYNLYLNLNIINVHAPVSKSFQTSKMN
jgi:hypothetical protein